MLFTHSSVDGYLALLNNVWTLLYKYLFESVSVLLGLYLGVELLGHIVSLLRVWGTAITAIVFSKVVHDFTFLSGLFSGEKNYDKILYIAIDFYKYKYCYIDLSLSLILHLSLHLYFSLWIIEDAQLLSFEDLVWTYSLRICNWILSVLNEISPLNCMKWGGLGECFAYMYY